MMNFPQLDRTELRGKVIGDAAIGEPHRFHREDVDVVGSPAGPFQKNINRVIAR